MEWNGVCEKNKVIEVTTTHQYLVKPSIQRVPFVVDETLHRKDTEGATAKGNASACSSDPWWTVSGEIERTMKKPQPQRRQLRRCCGGWLGPWQVNEKKGEERGKRPLL